MRDLPGFLETRQALLELKSANKHNWISFALAHHLNGHHEVAVKVLESYEGGPLVRSMHGCCQGAGKLQKRGLLHTTRTPNLTPPCSHGG